MSFCGGFPLSRAVAIEWSSNLDRRQHIRHYIESKERKKLVVTNIFKRSSSCKICRRNGFHIARAHHMDWMYGYVDCCIQISQRHHICVDV